MESGGRTAGARMDWRSRFGAPPRTQYTSETKPFFLTSEFVVFVLYMMGLGIAALTSDEIDAQMFWILTTIATFGYMLSRGVAKAGTRSRAHDPREDVDLGHDRRAAVLDPDDGRDGVLHAQPRDREVWHPQSGIRPARGHGRRSRSNAGSRLRRNTSELGG